MSVLRLFFSERCDHYDAFRDAAIVTLISRAEARTDRSLLSGPASP
jgi:hypothetical protein